MSQSLVIAFSGICVLGIVSQWIAWRLRLPSILLLLITGILVGPILGWIDPDVVFQQVLFPIVSLSVAIILFDGGLKLKFEDIRDVGGVVRNLISVGAVTTWIITGLSAYYFLDFSPHLAILLGAILIVTGPTVIIPMLRYIRLQSRLSSILRWECVNNDTVGAIVAVLTFEAIIVVDLGDALRQVLLKILITLLVAPLLGFLGATLIVFLFKRHLVPEYLHEAITFITVLIVFNLSHFVQPESGLLAVTVMGIVLANQHRVSLSHVVIFKENLTVLLLSSVFVMLAARLELDQVIALMDWDMLGFLLVIIFVGRPLSVFLSTVGSPLTVQEKLFLSWMAPRGIVAAAVSSLFALELSHHGFPDADQLVLVTFMVIIVTVCLYGLSSRVVANFLGVSQDRFKGILIVGAHSLSREIAKVLIENDLSVLLVDTNKLNVASARAQELPVIHGNIMHINIQEEIESYGMGKLFAMTQNDEVNMLAALEFSDSFTSSNIFRLALDQKVGDSSLSYPKDPEKGRLLFSPGVTYSALMSRLNAGGQIQAFDFEQEQTVESFFRNYPKAIPLFYVTQKGRLVMVSEGVSTNRISIKTLIALT